MSSTPVWRATYKIRRGQAKPGWGWSARGLVPKILQLNSTSYDHLQDFFGTSAVCEVPATIAPARRHMSSQIAKILDKLGSARLFSRKCAQLNSTSYTRSLTGAKRNICQEECNGLFLHHTPMLNSAPRSSRLLADFPPTLRRQT